MFVVTNPLHMDEFKIVCQMEAEIIRMVANMYNGDKNSCGIVTSGGTESILLACLAYREKAKERGVTNPNMVMSETAHAAFDKAAFYFHIELRKVKITADCKADMRGIRKQIDSNTICLVASGPEYPYGHYDPVP
jgi:sphinganine-1-phosphate aldolase